MIKMIYFSFGAFTTLVVRGHRRTKLRGHRRQAERQRPVRRESEEEREKERGDGAEPRFILPLQPPDEHPPDHHSWGGHRATRNSWHCHVYYLYMNPRQQELSSIHWQVVEYCNTVTVRNRVEEKQKTMPMEERGPVTLSKEPLKVCRHLESV